MFPFLGWLDDTFLLGLIAYYLRYRRWPGFIYKLGRLLFRKKAAESGGYDETSSQRGKSGQNASAKKPQNAGEACEILKVTPDASHEEIQAAYRKAVQQYHPDKVAHLGDELQELAKKKFVQIQEAYTILTQNRS